MKQVLAKAMVVVILQHKNVSVQQDIYLKIYTVLYINIAMENIWGLEMSSGSVPCKYVMARNVLGFSEPQFSHWFLIMVNNYLSNIYFCGKNLLFTITLSN